MNKNRTKHEIVKYHNDLSEMPLQGLTAFEMDVFISFAAKCKEQSTNIVTITFQEMKKLTRYNEKGYSKFVNLLEKARQKISRMSVYVGTEDNNTLFTLFPAININRQDQTISVAVAPEYAYMLNNFIGNYTQYFLSEYVDIKSSYAKECYRHLKQFRTTGIWEVSIEDFRYLLDIPDSYRMSDINKQILNPIMQELGDRFEDLELERVYGSGRGKPVEKLIFTFKKEKQKMMMPWISPEIDREFYEGEFRRLQNSRKVVTDVEYTVIEDEWSGDSGMTCPDCGRPLVKKLMNGIKTYAHPDGFRKEAVCRNVYNSEAEIMAALEEKKKNIWSGIADGKICPYCDQPLHKIIDGGKRIFGHIDGGCSCTFNSDIELNFETKLQKERGMRGRT